MGKKWKKRLKRAAVAAGAIYGASKLMGGRGAANVDSGRGGDSASAIARRKANKPGMLSKNMGMDRKAPASKSSPFQSRMTGHGPQVNENISRGERARNLAAKNPKVSSVSDSGKVTYKSSTSVRTAGSGGRRSAAIKQKIANSQISDKAAETAIKKSTKKGLSARYQSSGGVIKARGGVMVNTKLNGKLYTETF